MRLAIWVILWIYAAQTYSSTENKPFWEADPWLGVMISISFGICIFLDIRELLR